MRYMGFWAKKDKSYYSCTDLEENVVLHRDWYSICSMFGHLNALYRPIFYWDDKKGFDYKTFLKTKRDIIKAHKKGKINPKRWSAQKSSYFIRFNYATRLTTLQHRRYEKGAE